MWIYCKDTWEARSNDSISWFAQSHSSDNGDVVQDKTAALVSEQSDMLWIPFFLISAVFLWTLLLLPAPTPFFFSLFCCLRASVCSLSFGYCSACYFIFKLFSGTFTFRSWLELDLTGNGGRKRNHSSSFFRVGCAKGRLMRDQGFAWMETVQCF